MSGNNTQVGRFSWGECDVYHEEGGPPDGAAVFDPDGQPFALIDPDTCLGGKEGAIERARLIAEVLNEVRHRIVTFRQTGGQIADVLELGPELIVKPEGGAAVPVKRFPFSDLGPRCPICRQPNPCLHHTPDQQLRAIDDPEYLEHARVLGGCADLGRGQDA